MRGRPVRHRVVPAIAGAVRTAVHGGIDLDAVSDDPAAASRAGRRERGDRAFEAVEMPGRSTAGDREQVVVLVAAGVARRHRRHLIRAASAAVSVLPMHSADRCMMSRALVISALLSCSEPLWLAARGYPAASRVKRCGARGGYRGQRTRSWTVSRMWSTRSRAVRESSDSCAEKSLTNCAASSLSLTLVSCDRHRRISKARSAETP